jgi:hypothetical protein
VLAIRARAGCVVLIGMASLAMLLAPVGPSSVRTIPCRTLANPSTERDVAVAFACAVLVHRRPTEAAKYATRSALGIRQLITDIARGRVPRILASVDRGQACPWSVIRIPPKPRQSCFTARTTNSTEGTTAWLRLWLQRSDGAWKVYAYLYRSLSRR